VKTRGKEKEKKGKEKGGGTETIKLFKVGEKVEQ